MIILGAGVNHWYHMDMNYRGMINMLISAVVSGKAAAAGRTMSVRKNCAHKPAGAAGLCA
ncbi:hypothetical protein ACVXHB_05905 [Escherichia coli]